MVENRQVVMNHSRTSSTQDLYENNNPNTDPPNSTKGNLDASENAVDDSEAGNNNERIKEETETARAVQSARSEEGQGRKNYRKDLCYPITLRQSSQDRLKISVMEFMPKQFNKKGFGFTRRGESNKTKGGMTIMKARKMVGAVTLPIPGAVTDSNTTKWGEDLLNAGQAKIAQAALAFLDKGMKAMVDTATDVAEDAAADPAVSNAVKQFFVGQATGVKGILARTEGAIINPNMELIFQGPQLRPFNFTFKLSPRDLKESQEILQIIRMFKQSMMPQATESNLFLKAPNTYMLQFISQGKNHKFLPKIKECALLSCNVNYTPDGSYMSYEDGSMVAYEMTLSFQELEPVFNLDSGNPNGSVGTDLSQGIGY